MVYHCAVAECKSHDAKRLRPDIHPWMQSVTWVKFPKKQTDRNRWKKLIRRGGKGKENVVDLFELHRNSRVCSRHFDHVDIENGVAKRDPHYFAWNNWGQPAKPRTSLATQKLDDARQISGAAVSLPLEVPVYNLVSDIAVPEISQQEEVATQIKTKKGLVGGETFFHYTLHQRWV